MIITYNFTDIGYLPTEFNSISFDFGITQLSDIDIFYGSEVSFTITSIANFEVLFEAGNTCDVVLKIDHTVTYRFDFTEIGYIAPEFNTIEFDFGGEDVLPLVDYYSGGLLGVDIKFNPTNKLIFKSVSTGSDFELGAFPDIINLDKGCDDNTSPTDFNLCSYVAGADFEYGQKLLFDLDTTPTVNVSQEFGQSLTVDLARFIDFRVNFEDGSEQHGFSFQGFNINLDETCNVIYQPTNVDVCQEGYIVNFGGGQNSEATLTGAIAATFDAVAEFGQNVICDTLQITDNFYPLVEFGQESFASLALYHLLVPNTNYFGQEFLSLDVIIPPRAFFELNCLYGSEVEISIASTDRLYPLAEFGSDVEVHLTPECITTIPLNTLRNGYFDNDCLSVNLIGRNAKYYTFTLIKANTVTIELTSSIDNYLFLLSGNTTGGTLLAQDNNSGVFNNAEIILALNAGTYTIEATHVSNIPQNDDFTIIVSIPPIEILDTDAYAGSEVELSIASSERFYPVAEFGSYAIASLKRAPNLDMDSYYGSDGDAYLTPSCITTIPINTLRNGIYESDCLSVNRSGSGTYAKFYTFTLLADKIVTIDLTSSIDTFLFLLNGAGTGGSIIAQDGGISQGGGYDAQIVLALSAGTYTVEATTRTTASSGTFTIRVSIPLPDIEDLEIYHGSDVISDLSINSRLFVDDYETGGEVVVDLLDNPFDKLEVEHETSSEMEVGISLSGNVITHSEFGSYSDVSLLTNIFDKLEVEFGYGSDSDVTLSITPNLTIDAELGAGALTDLEINLPDRFEVEFEFGSESLETNIYRAASFNSFASFGSELFIDIELALSEGIGVVTNYHGSEVVLNSIASEAFTIFNEFGSEFSAILETQQRFEVSYEFGSGSNFELEINPFDELEVLYEHGSEGSFDIATTLGFRVLLETGLEGVVDTVITPPRAYMILDAYHGLEAQLKETILNLNPIEYNLGLDFHVQHNHCESCCDNVDQIYGDSTLRLTDEANTTGQLNFEFSHDNFKDDFPWAICDFYEIKLDWGLSTNPRFEIDFEIETGSAIAYLPEEYIGFVADIPPAMLYLEYNNDPYTAFLEVEFTNTTGAYTWADDWTDETIYTTHAPQLSIELTETKYLEFYEGQSFNISTIITDVPKWRSTAFSPILAATAILTVELENTDYIRFCPGYIIPNGNQVNFELFGLEFIDCNVEWAHFGDMLHELELQTFPNIKMDLINGAVLTPTLTIELPWKVTFTLDEQFHFKLATTVRINPVFENSLSLQVELEPLAWIAGHSTVKVLCDLAVPGPDIDWITPPDCLENQYIALTETNDIDFLYYQPNPDIPYSEYPLSASIEKRWFKHNLDARCIKITEVTE